MNEVVNKGRTKPSDSMNPRRAGLKGNSRDRYFWTQRVPKHWWDVQKSFELSFIVLKFDRIPVYYGI